MLVANPLLAALAAFAAAVAPALAFWAGARWSGSFTAAAVDPMFVRVLAIGVAVSALVAGISVALLAPGLAALGPQVAVAPRSRATVAVGAVVAPVCVVGAAFAFLLVCFAQPLAGTTGVELVLLAVGCAALGAAFGEGARLAAARELAGPGALVAVGAAWLLAGVPGRAAPALGPTAAVGTSRALATFAAVTAIGLVLWAGACGVPRRERSPTRGAWARRLPASAGPAVAVAAARRVLRHPELRVHGVVAVVVPLAAAVGAAMAFGVDGPSATVFCVAVTLTATVLYPPAALGLARGARWLHSAAPRRRVTVSGAAVTGGVMAAAALVAGAAVSAAPLGVPEPSIYLQLEGNAAFVLGCAAVAGAAVPWHPDRVLHQLASYGAVLAAVVGGWLVVAALDVASATASGVAIGNAVLLLGIGTAATAAR